MFTVN